MYYKLWKKNDDGSFKRIFLIEVETLEFPPYVAYFMYIVQRTELQYDIEIVYEIVHNVWTWNETSIIMSFSHKYNGGLCSESHY